MSNNIRLFDTCLRLDISYDDDLDWKAVERFSDADLDVLAKGYDALAQAIFGFRNKQATALLSLACNNRRTILAEIQDRKIRDELLRQVGAEGPQP